MQCYLLIVPIINKTHKGANNLCNLSQFMSNGFYILQQAEEVTINYFKTCQLNTDN